MEFRFNGESEHTLDDKARLILPVRVRPAFQEAPGFLVRWNEGCLALWPEDRYFERLDQLYSQVDSVEATEDDRALLRMFSAGEQVKPDKQSRIVLSSRLKEFAGINTKVLVVGAYRVVEIWDPELWERRTLGPGERRLLGAAAT